MRTGLTMLGMIIGVSAVITLVAMGNGAQSVIEDQIKGAGTNMITVNAGNFTLGGVRGGAGSATTLTVDDAEAIRDEVAGRAISRGRASRTQQQVVAGNQNWFTRVQGTDVDLPLIRAWPMHERHVLQPAGRGRRRQGGACSGKTVNDTAVRRGRRPGRPDHPHPQPAVQGDRRDGGQGPGHGRATWTTRSSCPTPPSMKKLLGQQYIQNITVSAASADGDQRGRRRDRAAAADAPQDRARARTTTS